MATLTIHNLSEDVVERLKERAEQNGRSVEQEAREMLGQRKDRPSRSELIADLEEFRKTIPQHWLASAEEVEEWCAIARRGRGSGE